MATMKAAVIYEAGGPEALKIESRPIPVPKPGQVLIRVKAAGLNRSEMFTRQGHSPNVQFPRILGIEATGIVESAPGNEFTQGATVATAMGGMGRDFDGSFAEFVCVPATQVQEIADRRGLSWEVLGALPEMMQTAWGSLFTSLHLQKGETLLVRGGSTSVGLAASAIARAHGAIVISTTRSTAREELLRSSGAAEVVVDDGAVAAKVRTLVPEGVDKVLELVGVMTLHDSLACVRPGGIVCITGIVGGKWRLDGFNPMEVIPTAVCLTAYSGGAENFMKTPLNELVKQIAEGELRVHVGKTFSLDQAVAAQACMEGNQAGGKIVMLPDASIHISSPPDWPVNVTLELVDKARILTF